MLLAVAAPVAPRPPAPRLAAADLPASESRAPGRSDLAYRPPHASPAVRRIAVVDTSAPIGFLYINEGTNNRDRAGSPGVLSGFAAYADGRIEPLPGSPWVTGGFATSAPGLLAAPRLAFSPVTGCLYAIDQGSATVAVLRVDETGDLTWIPTSPFPTGAAGPEGLALSPDGRWLFVSHSIARVISVFGLDASGAPRPAGVPFDIDTVVAGMTVTPDGRFLVASLPHLARVAVLAIGEQGELSHAP